MSEYLDKSGLAYFWGKIRSCIDDIVDTIDSKVPATRKVNGKALSADITLGGDDINVAIGAISGTLNTFLTTIDGDVEYLTGVADGLADVASSGSYNDLTDKPTIPAASSVPNAASIDSSGLITFKNGSTNLFTLQLPVYSGSSSTIPSASGVSF